MTFPCPDPDEEGMQGPRRLRRRPGRFDEHRPGMAAADLADPAMLGEAETRLPNAWIEADKLTSFCGDGKRRMSPIAAKKARRDDDVHPRYGQEPLDGRITESVLRHLAIQQFEILAKPVEFAKMPLDRPRLVVREWLAFQPRSPDLAEHVGMRTARNQMGVQNGMHLVLDPRAMADDLLAPGHQTPHAFGSGRCRPDFGEKSRRVDARQNSGILSVFTCACVIVLT
jgi:hypothetical protein